MYSFGSFLQDLSLNTGINFAIIGEDNIPIYSNNLNQTNSDVSHFSICLGSNRAVLRLYKKYEVCAPLLKYTIENKYREIFSMREQSLIEILEGKEVPVEKTEKCFPFISKGCTLFIVNVDGSKFEALSIIRQLYSEQDIVSFVYGDNIILLGVFDEVEEHAYSIKESIVSDLYCKCFISYGNIIYNAKEITKAYDEAKECIILGKKFGMKEEIFYYNKLLFEKIVYNISSSVKNELLSKFKEKFNIFDNELVNTIEEFINCGLNISDTARKLYVHRNTLIYRLDKINKETGFDIRNFREATVFIIAFLVWKETIK